jgi:hypothetical protein
MSWELPAAMSMSRLWRDQGKRDEARELLAPVYGWFTEGFDLLDRRRRRRCSRSWPSEAIPLGHSGIAHSISLDKAVTACSFQGTAHTSRIFH